MLIQFSLFDVDIIVTLVLHHLMIGKNHTPHLVFISKC